MPVDEAQRAAEIYSRAAEKRQPIHLQELRFLHKDGREVIIESSATPFFDEQGTLRGVRGIDRNVTERHQAEVTLERSHEFYRTLFDEFPLPIWRSSADGRIIYYNRRGVEFIGRELDTKLVASQLGEIHPDDCLAYVNGYFGAFERRQPFTLSYRLRRYDGLFHTICHVGQPCFGPEGRFIGYLGYFHAIDEPGNVEWPLRQTHITQEGV